MFAMGPILICLLLAVISEARTTYSHHKSVPSDDISSKFELENMVSLLSRYDGEFQTFKQRYNKSYSSMHEENSRFLNFISSLLEINHHNQLYENGQKSYEIGINHLSDWSGEELAQLTKLKQSNLTGSSYLSSNVKIDLPDSFDWREKGAVTEVKNQGFCGSCYAFATTGTLEAQIWRKTGKLISLSEQQIVDCDTNDDGCDGGFVQDALSYIKSNGGIENEESYPYISSETFKPNSKCNFFKSKVVATDTGFVQMPANDETKMKEALVTIGPISVAISATKSLKRYTSGIFHEDECDKLKLNHAVLIVGYGTDQTSGTPYWIIKNSWSSFWGENGYFRLPRNINACKVAMMPVYPLV